MAEAELRRETEKLYQDIGISDLPPDSLDFFEKNLENGSSSTEWKRGLKPPAGYNSSRAARRTSSDGTALVHLKKKYATGLNPDYHSKRTAAIAAVTNNQKPENSSSNKGSSTPTKLKNRKVSPAGILGSRFGFTGASKVTSPQPPAETGSGQQQAPAEKSNTASFESKEPGMFKRRSQQRSSIHSPPPAAENQGQVTSSKRLTHTSSAGAITRHPAPPPPPNSSSATTSKVQSGPSNREETDASTPYSSKSNSTAFNGVHSGVVPTTSAAAAAMMSASRAAASNSHSHSSSESTAPNNSTTSTSSRNNSSSAVATATPSDTASGAVHTSIDTNKHSSVNMRSLTKSAERKISDGKPSFIPTPSSSGSSISNKGSNSSSCNKVAPPTSSSDSGSASSNTQVLYNRKSSFKVINVSSSSHRIMHTVQDGGAPKRHNSINRGSVNRGARPISVVATQQQSSRPPPAPSSTSHENARSLSPTPQENTRSTSPVPFRGQESLPPKLEKQQSQHHKVEGSGARSSGHGTGYDSLGTHLVNGETSSAKPPSQGRSGVYDRLSPPVDKPPSTAAAPAKKEPVYEIIGENRKDLPSPPAAKDGGISSPRQLMSPTSPRELTSPRTLTSPRELTSPKGFTHSKSPSPVKENGVSEVASTQQGISRQDIPAVAKMLRLGENSSHRSSEVTRSLNLTSSRHLNGASANITQSLKLEQASASASGRHAPPVSSGRIPSKPAPPVSSGHAPSRPTPPVSGGHIPSRPAPPVSSGHAPLRPAPPVSSGHIPSRPAPPVGSGYTPSRPPPPPPVSSGHTPSRPAPSFNSGHASYGHAPSSSRNLQSNQSKLAAPIKRYSIDSGAVYTAVNKTSSKAAKANERKISLPPQLVLERNEREVYSPEGEVKVHHERSSSYHLGDDHHNNNAVTNQNPVSVTSSLKPHKPLAPSLSDSTSRARSAWLPIPSSGLEASSDSSLHSTASMEPVSDSSKRQDWNQNVENMDEEERKAKLEVNWSMQSLNANMKEVAGTTVAALSTLMEVLTTPSTTTADKKFTFDTVDGPSSENKWYQDSYEEGPTTSNSITTTSIVPAISPTISTSPINFSAPRQPAEPVSSSIPQHRSSRDNMTHGHFSEESSRRKASDERPRRKVSDEGSSHKKIAKTQSSPSHNSRVSTQQSGRTGHCVAAATNGKEASAHVDGPSMSRHRSDGKVKVNSPKPPAVPPKTKRRERSKSAGTINKNLRPAAGNRTGPAGQSGGPSRRIVSVETASYNKGHSTTEDVSKPASLTSLESFSSRSASHASASRSSLTSQGSGSTAGSGRGVSRVVHGPLNHEYAILEPPEHDYAILDPEYHEEFYGYCACCSEPVIGTKNGCAAVDKVYHVKCFICFKCGVSLTSRKFYIQDDKLLCEKDHQEVILERCYYCKRNIYDRVIKALGHAYHPTCFRCFVCGKCLDGVHYTNDNKNRFYCIQDYHKIYGPKCDVCGKPIVPKSGQKKSLRVIAMDKNYHMHCYKCEDCSKQLANRTGGGEKCYPLNGHLLCKSCHAHRVQKRTTPTSPHQHSIST